MFRISLDVQKPAAEDIRAQVGRIFESGGFEKYARLRDFLSYGVEETLGGRSAYLKALPIAQVELGADDKFNPEANSIVRVEAGRLRRRLTQYYSTIGLHDPTIIAVLKGTYAPESSQNFVPDAR